MSDFLAQFGKLLIYGITGTFSIFVMLSLFSNTTITTSEPFNNLKQNTPVADVAYTPPTVEEADFIVNNAILDEGATFEWKDYVEVVTSNGLDIIDYVTVDGTVDTSVPGEYPLKFTLNFNGVTIVKETTFYVREG